MDNNRDMEMFGCKNNRNSYKTALGNNNIRFQLFQDFTCLTIAFSYKERISEVFWIKIASQLSGSNSIVRYV